MSEFTHRATLVHGTTFFLGTKRFDKGVPKNVTADEKEYLSANAIDVKTIEGGDVHEKAKFKFEEIDDEAEATDETEVAARAPTSRRRG